MEEITVKELMKVQRRAHRRGFLEGFVITALASSIGMVCIAYQAQRKELAEQSSQKLHSL